MKFKIEAGAEVDILSEPEARKIFADWIEEVRRGVRYVRRSMQGTTTAGGALSAVGAGFTESGQDMGPAGSMVWAISRISVHGMAAADRVSVFANGEGGPAYVGDILFDDGSVMTFPGPALVLNPLERLIVSGAGLPASSVITINVQAIEIPIQLMWQLI